MADFLLEIGTEEIPDWIIDGALSDLRDKFRNTFGAFGGNALRTEATPRRLVLLAEALSERAPDTQTVVQGPYLSAGPKAAEGFARKNSTTVEQLSTLPDTKGERYVFHQLVQGQALVDALRDKLPGIVTNIHFPKSMYWAEKGGVRFIRPLRWIVALLDDQVVSFEIGDVWSSNLTRGHRVLGSKEPLAVTISTYEQILRDNFVIVRAEERKKRIIDGLGERVQHDSDLLDTLVYLTEFPSVIYGSFDPSFLQLPREILSTVMRHHQRYFSVVKPDDLLAPEFVAVTNTDGDPDGLIRQGNERVLRARFNDARFFWEVDQRKKLSDRIPDLEKITFQAKLGNYLEKRDRVQRFAHAAAKSLSARLDIVERAVSLSKCDLTTNMVKEFPELQGVVGGLYAKAQGEGEAVATAICEHYKPVSMEDSPPSTPEGQAVSIADKLDTLCECFRIGLIPTGSKDPLALRRAAQGIVRILFETDNSLNLIEWVKDDVPALVPFFKERIEFYLREVRGFAYDEVKAVMAVKKIGTLPDLADRAEAIHYIRPTEDFEPVAASFKRIKNILEQAKQAGITFADEPNPELLAPGPEKDLYDAFTGVRTQIGESSSYREKLSAMASLRPQVDLFFDKILVNDPNPAIRQNRLALLNRLSTEFSSIANFSEIVTEGGSGI